MLIKYLPQHLINKLKAGEIVERPASIVKELLENALDAGATSLTIKIREGGISLIQIEDDGSGIGADDLPLAVARYATSKISTAQDLEHIMTYGFRGEALAAIAEVSDFTIQTKTETTEAIGYELIRHGEDRKVKEIPYGTIHGTIVTVQDLFHSVPVRQKFLKTAKTERLYIRSLLYNYLLLHRDKSRYVWHDEKLVRGVPPATSLSERVIELTKSDRLPHLHPFESGSESMQIYGILGDASLHFTTPEHIRIFVNRRPVEDKIIKKALMQAVHRQMPAGVSPLAYLFLEIDPSLLDVNVHPRKSEVRFLDPGRIFSFIESAITQHFSTEKVSYAAFTQPPVRPSTHRAPQGSTPVFRWKKSDANTPVSYHQNADNQLFDMIQQDHTELSIGEEPVHIIGQLRQTYILAQSPTGVYLIDQHALAERIAFEQMKTQIAASGFLPEVLLQPYVFTLVGQDADIDGWIQLAGSLGMDAAQFGTGKVVVYSVPQVFQTYQIDLEIVCSQLSAHQTALTREFASHHTPEEIFGIMIEEIVGMKACKASIKAGQSLSIIEMRHLVAEGMRVIPTMFVCQHGRPSIVKLSRQEIDGWVGR